MVKIQGTDCEIVVRCSYRELVPIAKLAHMRDPKNRNQHPAEQIDELVKQFEFQGIRHPIIISNRSRLFAAGDGRFQAAEKMGLLSFPVDYQDFDSEESEYAFRIADNAIQGWSHLDLSGIHLDLPNLQPFEIERLAIPDFKFEPDFAPGTEDDQGKLDEKKPVVCPKCGESFVTP